MEKRFRNKLEISREFGVSEKTIDRWVRNLKFPRMKLGNAVRFCPDACARWALARMEGDITAEQRIGA